MKTLRFSQYELNVDRPLIMGIVNLTPDSFSGDGCSSAGAIEHARRQWEAGADILDIGAESSRPGADPVVLEEEMARLRPVLVEVVRWGVPISVDTYKPEVMRWAADCGVAIINDIAALRQPGALNAVAGTGCAICLMHMQGEPRNMQVQPHYSDVVAGVNAFLRERVEVCLAAGISPDRLILDPGFGFGKTLKHNTDLFCALESFKELSLPILVGVSRKRMLGEIIGDALPSERVTASVTAAVLAAQRGAQILRVHDVAATREALAVWQALSRNT